MVFQSSSELMVKAKTLSENTEATKAAVAKVESVVASKRITYRSVITCLIFSKLAEKLMSFISQNPASTGVKVRYSKGISPHSSPMQMIAEKMSSAGDVACTDDEKAALKEKKDKLDSAVEALVSALEVAMEDLASKSSSLSLFCLSLSVSLSYSVKLYTLQSLLGQLRPLKIWQSSLLREPLKPPWPPLQVEGTPAELQWW